MTLDPGGKKGRLMADNWPHLPPTLRALTVLTGDDGDKELEDEDNHNVAGIWETRFFGCFRGF